MIWTFQNPSKPKLYFGGIFANLAKILFRVKKAILDCVNNLPIWWSSFNHILEGLSKIWPNFLFRVKNAIWTVQTPSLPKKSSLNHTLEDFWPIWKNIFFRVWTAILVSSNTLPAKKLSFNILLENLLPKLANFFFSRSNHFSIIFLRIFRQNQPVLFSGSKMPFSFQNPLLPVNSLDYIFEDFWLRGVLFSANLHGKFKSGALKFQLKLGNWNLAQGSSFESSTRKFRSQPDLRSLTYILSSKTSKNDTFGE